MTSKTKALKKGNYIPGNNPAPAVSAEKKDYKSTVNHIKRDKRKEAMSRTRQRRLKALIRAGLSEEEILKIFDHEDTRIILCLYYGSFTFEDGTIKKTVRERNKQHKVIGEKEIEVPNVLHGRNAVEKFLEKNNITTICTGPTYCHIKTDKEHVDEIVKMLEPIGRTSITAPEKETKESLEKKKNQERKTANKANKKPTNNTEEAKSAAKEARKNFKKNRFEMRPYYAAKRKGGVSARIKKFNPTLAEKIEAWLKEQNKIKESRKKGSYEERAKHRQLTSIEMKANKRARKVAKLLATKERIQEREKKRAEYNAKKSIERAQKAQKPIQTELKMAA
jgi:hypothetical protein